MLLVSILGYILLVLGVLLTSIILIPYDYSFTGENLVQSQIKGSVSWLFGGLKLTFSQYSKQDREMTLSILGIAKKLSMEPKSAGDTNKKAKKDKRHDKNNKHVQPAKSKKRFDFHTYLKPEIIKKVISLASKILKHCQPKILAVYGRIGFDDPMYTGFLCALQSQFSWLFNKYDLRIEPVFDEEVLEGRFSIGGRIWLAYLILVMMWFLITKPIRNIILANLKRKNKGGPQYVR